MKLYFQDKSKIKVVPANKEVALFTVFFMRAKIKREEMNYLGRKAQGIRTNSIVSSVFSCNLFDFLTLRCFFITSSIAYFTTKLKQYHLTENFQPHKNFLTFEISLKISLAVILLI